MRIRLIWENLVKSFKKSWQLIFLISIILGIIFFCLLLFFFFIEPSSLVDSVLISNVTDQQATISWTTQKPTRSVIILATNSQFPYSPILTKEIYKDDGERNLNRSRFYLTHQVTINQLKPSTKYNFRIYQGFKRAYEGSFTTGPSISVLNGPNPVYGQILNIGKKPLIGAIVLLKIKNGSLYSSLLSTLTNQQGRYNLDLANLRTKNLKDYFKIGTGSAEIMVVEFGNNKVKAETKVGQDKPWPDIIVR